MTKVDARLRIELVFRLNIDVTLYAYGLLYTNCLRTTQESVKITNLDILIGSLRGLVVSTLDYESRDCGSNPDRGDFPTISKLAASESTQLEMSTPVV